MPVQAAVSDLISPVALLFTDQSNSTRNPALGLHVQRSQSVTIYTSPLKASVLGMRAAWGFASRGPVNAQQSSLQPAFPET